MVFTIKHGYALLRHHDQAIDPENTRDYVRRTSRTSLLSSHPVTRRRGLALAAIGTLILILLCFILSPIGVKQLTANARIALLDPAKLHVLVPASRADVNLCKVLLSAAILGYPSPVIINWNQNYTDPQLVSGGAHLAKIAGIHDYVASLDSLHDEDLVLVIDGFDIWMQLRPQTLIDRYFAINQIADQRIRRELGNVAAAHDIRQEIVFGCQKRCWPWSPDDTPCYAVPNSTLPVDVFGSRTDTDSVDENTPYINYRPRFLNSGGAIGTVRAMRKLFGQALTQAQQEGYYGSDQYIISHIYGDQEVWREAIRRDALTGTPSRMRREESHAKDFFNSTDLKAVRAKAAAREDGNFEFGIGVDFGSEIILNTVFAENDTAWLAFSNRSAVEEALSSHFIDTEVQALEHVSDDITSTPPPFWTLSSEEAPRQNKWGGASLFTDLYTGIVPAIIHHNAHRDGMKSLRKTWWPRIWFKGYGRELFDAQIYTPVVPVATSGYGALSQRKWWPSETRKGGARDGLAKQGSDNEGWIGFEDICGKHGEELFMDGKGPWKLPDEM